MARKEREREKTEIEQFAHDYRPVANWGSLCRPSPSLFFDYGEFYQALPGHGLKHAVLIASGCGVTMWRAGEVSWHLQSIPWAPTLWSQRQEMQEPQLQGFPPLWVLRGAAHGGSRIRLQFRRNFSAMGVKRWGSDWLWRSLTPQVRLFSLLLSRFSRKFYFFYTQSKIWMPLRGGVGPFGMVPHNFPLAPEQSTDLSHITDARMGRIPWAIWALAQQCQWWPRFCRPNSVPPCHCVLGPRIGFWGGVLFFPRNESSLRGPQQTPFFAHHRQGNQHTELKLMAKGWKMPGGQIPWPL